MYLNTNYLCSLRMNIPIAACFAALLFLTSIECKDQCVMRGQCADDETTDLEIPCVYNGDPVPLKDQESIDFLTSVCPSLKLDSDHRTCCDSDQVHSFKKSLNQLGSLFKRCPSCYHNLANVFCHLTCSPVQSRFLKVTDIVNIGGNLTVNEMNYFLSESFANGMFNSCSNVQLAFSGQKAITVACGGVSDCTPQKWFDYMGGHDPSPYQINFLFEEKDVVPFNGSTFYPMNDEIIPCSRGVGEGGVPCSCADCPCNPQPPPEFPKNDSKLFGLPLMESIMIIIYVILAIVIIGGFIYAGFHKRSEEDQLLINDTIRYEDSSVCARWGSQLDAWLKSVFTRWGLLCATYPFVVLLIASAFIVFAASGLYFFKVQSDPVQLWSAPSSQAREEKDYFDSHFGPFYRTEQIIIKRLTGDPVVGTNLTFSPVFDRDFLHQILDLQNNITSLTAERKGHIVNFKDICFAPLDKGRCMIQSAVNWFQNDARHLDYYELDEYLEFLKNCTSNPFYVQSKGLSCLGEYGGPVFPYVALGGVGDENYANASALILTLMVRNYANATKVKDAEAWEAKFIEFMKNFKHPEMEIAYSSERSIKDELDRESKTDEKTILISYLVMFAYVSITLGQYNSIGSLFVNSKLMLGLSGILIVLASVVSSLGLFSYMGVPATLIIIEVIPFLVLAVGVDNIFIIVQAYQRSRRGPLETRQQHIGRVIGEVTPSIFLASFAESICFFLGGLSNMPAVRVFAIYSGMALFIDFLLQMTCFVALLSLDVAREESGRFDICCCIKVSERDDGTKERKGLLYRAVEKFYAPFLMNDFVRCCVMLVFSAWICTSIAVIDRIDVGLDQKLSMAKDSYVLKYFTALEEYLSVGPPVYFVVKDGLNYSELEDQDYLCSVAYCHRDSLVTQVSEASQFSDRTYIAHPPMDWLDNYFSWTIDGTGCCRVNKTNPSQFCPTNVTDGCTECKITDSVHNRPYPNKFQTFLKYFLSENPTPECPVAGHAGFADALQIKNDGTVGATHFMTYHTILKTSDDFTQALRWARKIADNITETFRLYGLADSTTAEVFPYSIFYVFYEQYLTVSKDTVVSLTISLIEIFVVTFLLMGLDYHSALIMVFTIMMIIFNLMGMMYFWEISLNAVSLVNLVMAVGISVEFCSHIIRSFAFNPEGSKIDRARNAVARMGSSVLSGITLTKFGGIVVLAFSKSQIFQVFYFRMYLGIVLIGATHGLIFLPVFLSIVGPSVKPKYDRSGGHPLKVHDGEDAFSPDVTSLSEGVKS